MIKITVEEKLLENGYENVVILKDYDFETAFIGVSDDNRAVYDYDKMLSYLIDNGICANENTAIDYLYNGIIRWLGTMSDKAPIIVTTF